MLNEKDNKRLATLYKSLEQYPERKEFVDIVSQFLYKENENVTCEISIGKRISEQKFISYLTSRIDTLRVCLSEYHGEQQFIFRDEHNAICLANLAIMKNIICKTVNCDSFKKYTIDFESMNCDKTYNDYCMSFSISK